jgi:hypothetical protein
MQKDGADQNRPYTTEALLDLLSADAEGEHEGVIHGEHVGLGESGAGRLAGVHGAGQVFTLSRGCR